MRGDTNEEEQSKQICMMFQEGINFLKQVLQKSSNRPETTARGCCMIHSDCFMLLVKSAPMCEGKTLLAFFCLRLCLGRFRSGSTEPPLSLAGMLEHRLKQSDETLVNRAQESHSHTHSCEPVTHRKYADQIQKTFSIFQRVDRDFLNQK